MANISKIKIHSLALLSTHALIYTLGGKKERQLFGLNIIIKAYFYVCTM